MKCAIGHPGDCRISDDWKLYPPSCNSGQLLSLRYGQAASALYWWT